MATVDDAFAVLPMCLKEEQRIIIKNLLNGDHVFALLPTGYGKSACYGFFGPVMDMIHPGAQHLVIVISPLTSLMNDQVFIWRGHGIKCAAVTSKMSAEDRQNVLDCKTNLVFISPEAAVEQPWWGWLKANRKKVCLLAVDEVHCMTSWGISFRPDYLKVPKLRSVMGAPLLLLTATATQEMMTTILDLLHIDYDSTKIICKLPDRSNIFLEVQKTKCNNIATVAEWIVPHLKQGKTAEKLIIYCRTINILKGCYAHIMKALGKDAWTSEEHSVDTRILDMYHSHIDKESEGRIMSTFPTPQSPLHCVVATVAFGLGVHVPDVRHVVHWGPATDILSYWQEVGRCARDGLPGRAILYVHPRSVNKSFIKGDMIDMLKRVDTGACIRKYIQYCNTCM